MKIFVGCSSHDEIPVMYQEESKKLLEKLMKDNDLVFGAYDHGIMNIAYEETLKNNNNVLSIVPKQYEEDLKRLRGNSIVTKDVCSRTQALIDNCDLLLFLPGGIGTLHEMFTAIELKRSHEFDKQIIIFNCCGFYDEIEKILDKMYLEKFIPDHLKNIYMITNNIEDVLTNINKNS